VKVGTSGQVGVDRHYGAAVAFEERSGRRRAPRKPRLGWRASFQRPGPLAARIRPRVGRRPDGRTGPIFRPFRW
jgi:hypothetical protein